MIKISKRTKNRLREHDLTIDFTKTNCNIVGFDNRVMVFATCQKCGWFGWLPKDEV